MKKLCYVIFAVLLVGVFSASNSTANCGKYRGDNKPLYTEAVCSLLWTAGYSWGADFTVDPRVTVLEEDNYGRVLFEYEEDGFVEGDIPLVGLLIAQKQEKELVYFYEDVNFVTVPREEYSASGEKFSSQTVEELKTVNDWGKPLSLDKCVKKEVIRKREKADFTKYVIDELVMTEPVKKIAVFVLTENGKGATLFYGVLVTFDGQTKYYAGMIGEDKSVAYIFIENVYDYAPQLKEFKQANNWF